MPVLEAGQAAPAFVLPDADGSPVALADFRGKRNLVVYFYPKDDTDGCTKQAVDFTELQYDFHRLDTDILGISRDDGASHRRFRRKHGITIPLLSDVDGSVCVRYGVWQPEGAATFVRSTFLIDMLGRLRLVSYGVEPRGHAVEVLKLVADATRVQACG